MWENPWLDNWLTIAENGGAIFLY